MSINLERAKRYHRIFSTQKRAMRKKKNNKKELLEFTKRREQLKKIDTFTTTTKLEKNSS